MVGSLNYDHVVTVDQLPGRGQTVSGHGYISVPGGKGLNQAVTASRLGARVSMVGCLGDDTAGSSLRHVLTSERASRPAPSAPSPADPAARR